MTSPPPSALPGGYSRLPIQKGHGHDRRVERRDGIPAPDKFGAYRLSSSEEPHRLTPARHVLRVQRNGHRTANRLLRRKSGGRRGHDCRRKHGRMGSVEDRRRTKLRLLPGGGRGPSQARTGCPIAWFAAIGAALGRRPPRFLTAEPSAASVSVASTRPCCSGDTQED